MRFASAVSSRLIDDAPHEGGPALNLEALGGRLPGGYENSILNFFLTPRPHIGTTIAFGKTDEFYWGVTWDAKLIDRTFFEASFGGAVHDGPLDTFRRSFLRLRGQLQGVLPRSASLSLRIGG